MISLSLVLFIALVLLVAGLVLFQNWRVTVPLLVGAELCRIGLLWQIAGFASTAGRQTLTLVEVVTALSVGLILLVTALTFTRDYNTEQLDEFGLMELRRAARRAQQQRAQIGGRWAGYVVPLGAVLLAGLATWLLGRAYPIARDELINAAWTFMLLCGLLVLITANDVLKLGLGLLLLLSAAKLLYFGVASQLNVLHIGLLELLSLLLAVVAAYVSGLLYGRLRTLEFSSLFDRR